MFHILIKNELNNTKKYMNCRKIFVLDRIRNIFQINNLHKKGVVGKDVTVAVLDTGIYAGHPDIKGSCIAFYDAVNGKRYMYDDNGHGTHISGIIGGKGLGEMGKYRGIAPGCNLVSVKVLNYQGKGKMDNIRKGIGWILNNRKMYNISIVNMSVGATDSAESEESELVELVEMMWDVGITVVAAAGNNGPGNCSVSSPGISRKIITVGASDDNIMVYSATGKNMVNYSGRGPTASCIVKPEIVAPGYNVTSCSTGNRLYTGRSGTSMATPIVSGICALYKGVYRNASPKEIKMQIHNSALDLGYPKNRQGWGLINLQKYLL